ncbi:Clp protease N-terminal domain-containing protein [Fimbriiglobus ruber]|uniref:ATP-dependent Clp protease, ATP-binding subunit n=1 Tax=Fimbriiglobus ruber TaxID=1908690 RepID=A0A225DJV0_9BACT|nr:Clp protease N-terminal domain-containing protein [Fimbriiglobus ruber]OWK36417.1 ATP-dependent Clp protease, ATP-binding subunit [Fimbriiglobus ruber]
MLGWLFQRMSAFPPANAATVDELLPLAQYEAVTYGQEFIGTQHLLLALTRLVDRAAGRALSAVGVTRQRLQVALADDLKGDPGEVLTGPLPITPTARRAIAWAADEARARQAPVAEPEHLLLALMADGIGLAALIRLGVDLERLGELLVTDRPNG